MYVILMASYDDDQRRGEKMNHKKYKHVSSASEHACARAREATTTTTQLLRTKAIEGAAGCGGNVYVRAGLSRQLEQLVSWILEHRTGGRV